jgi:hypothetical protein
LAGDLERIGTAGSGVSLPERALRRALLVVNPQARQRTGEIAVERGVVLERGGGGGIGGAGAELALVEHGRHLRARIDFGAERDSERVSDQPARIRERPQPAAEVLP